MNKIQYAKKQSFLHAKNPSRIFERIYKILHKTYGKQGWWPIINNKTLICEYGEAIPRNESEVFEICIGAILTQNTAWQNVEKAIANLKKLRALNARAIAGLDINKLKSAIKPAGYFNQKARKIREFTRFYLGLKGRIPTRDELLGVWGIGHETADSILLYAFNLPSFVVDAYTKRIFTNLKLIDKNLSYDKIKSLFEDNLPRDVELYQEYHALIVEHAKRYYKRKPYGKNDPLKKL